MNLERCDWCERPRPLVRPVWGETWEEVGIRHVCGRCGRWLTLWTGPLWCACFLLAFAAVGARVLRVVWRRIRGG